MVAAHLCGRVKGGGVCKTWFTRIRVGDEVLVSGGPPVPRIREGSWVRCGMVRVFRGSSLSWGVLVPVVGVKSAGELCWSQLGVLSPVVGVKFVTELVLVMGLLVPVMEVKFAVEFCLVLALVSAKGMASNSLPSSSARSVMARLVEPRMSWRPRTK